MADDNIQNSKKHTRAANSTKKNEDASDQNMVAINRNSLDSGKLFWGLLLISLGVLFIMDIYLDINLWQNFGPIVIIIIGFSVTISSFSRK